MQLLYLWGMAVILKVCSVHLPLQADYSSLDWKYHRVILRLLPQCLEIAMCRGPMQAGPQNTGRLWGGTSSFLGRLPWSVCFALEVDGEACLVQTIPEPPGMKECIPAPESRLRGLSAAEIQLISAGVGVAFPRTE